MDVQSLTFGDWNVSVVIDFDGHLNVYVSNEDMTKLTEINSGDSCSFGDELHYSFTTEAIERDRTMTFGELTTALVSIQNMLGNIHVTALEGQDEENLSDAMRELDVVLDELGVERD